MSTRVTLTTEAMTDDEFYLSLVHKVKEGNKLSIIFMDAEKNTRKLSIYGDGEFLFTKENN